MEARTSDETSPNRNMIAGKERYCRCASSWGFGRSDLLYRQSVAYGNGSRVASEDLETKICNQIAQ